MSADPITAADIETWARVESAIKGKAMDLCADSCGHPTRPCTRCEAARHPHWRGNALTLIKGGLAAAQE